MKLGKKGSIIGQVVSIGFLLLWDLKDSNSPSICSWGNENESEESGMEVAHRDHLTPQPTISACRYRSDIHSPQFLCVGIGV